MDRLNPYYKSKKYIDSRKRIENAYNYVDCDFDEVPIIIQTAIPVATGQDHDEFPKDYFVNPKSQLEFQTKGIEEHLEKVDDDYIPYFWPWYGSCIMQDYFNASITFPKDGDPAAFPAIKSKEDAKKLKRKDFEEADLMERTIKGIKYLKENGQYPVSVADTQSTLDCLSGIIGYQNLFYWMKDDPEFVDYLIDLIGSTLIDWLKYQKNIIGEENDDSNGIVSIRPPDGVGAWFSDDDMVLLSPDLYKRFIAKHYNRLFKDFGNVMMHWCGDGNHNVDIVTDIENLKIVHNFFLGKIDSAVVLQNKLKDKKILLVTGDYMPVKEQIGDYLNSITENLDPTGLILNFWVYSRLGLKDGNYVETKNDQMEIALRILDYFRG